jgi:hypothetical protein
MGGRMMGWNIPEHYKSIKRVRGRLPTVIAEEKKLNPDVIINVKSSDPLYGYGETHWFVLTNVWQDYENNIPEEVTIVGLIWGSQRRIDEFDERNPLPYSVDGVE